MSKTASFSKQVVKKMVSKQMIPIFGVTEKVLRLYEDLRAFFPYGSVGVLKEDSENLVDLIYKEYAVCDKIDEMQNY